MRRKLRRKYVCWILKELSQHLFILFIPVYYYPPIAHRASIEEYVLRIVSGTCSLIHFFFVFFIISLHHCNCRDLRYLMVSSISSIFSIKFSIFHFFNISPMPRKNNLINNSIYSVSCDLSAISVATGTDRNKIARDEFY